jgi:hypothetical protein
MDDETNTTETESTGGNESTIDTSGGGIYDNSTGNTGGTTTNYQDSWWDQFKNAAGNFDLSKLISSAGSVLTGGHGTAAQLAALGGIASLVNQFAGGNSGGGGFAGYKGGIPKYTASRTMNPIPTTVPNPEYVAPAQGQTTNVPQTIARRPGSGGISYFGPQTYTAAAGGGLMAGGGIASLGSYSDGGRLLKGPGDGVSDSIPAVIGEHQEARLADGEFVVPARIVSELGNGSTEAGARKLYSMMDRIQKARKKSLKNVAADSKAEKMLPA